MKISEEIQQLIKMTLAEDIGDGDHSSLSCIPENVQGEMKLLVKADGILCGVDVAREVLRQVDDTIQMEQYMNDGDVIHKGDIVFRLRGSAQKMLTAERTVLNFMQRMSGIATMTNKYVKLIEGTGAHVLDTRKTTPGMRMLEKQAVKIGGGVNHRIGLFDMILLKDNHVDFAGGIENAIDRCHHYLNEKGLDLKIEIEVRNFNELQQVLDKGGVNRIMLDNFTVADTKKAVDIINHRFEVESSGGITFDTIRSYAEQGVDFISVGALTHSVKGLDMSFKAC